MKKIFIGILLILLAVALVVLLRINNQAKNGRHFSRMTVKVVDEEGRAIEGADVYIGFGISSGWTSSKGKTFHGKSNADGEFSAFFNGINKIGGSVYKQGYYRSSYSFEQYKYSKFFWQPWNPKIEVVLRKKINPIPLYAKKVKLKMPKDVDKVYYDLFVGDLVKPYGNGISTNLSIEFTGQVFGLANYELNYKIKFNHAESGLTYIPKTTEYTNSVFKLPYSAFEEGYEQKTISSYIKSNNGMRSDNSSEKVSNNCFFRLNVSTNSLRENYYGKISNFKAHLARSGNRYINFTYYLNPTPNDRNLEFNTKSNLFQNLDRSERVSSP